MADENLYGVTQSFDPDSGESSAEVAPADDAPQQQPERIGRYRIVRVLGKGGFGLVYLAHDEQLDRLVAIKVPHAKLISQPEDAQAYLAEARTVANLDHPGIVPVASIGIGT
jgi:serine/threonine protein kinase